MKSCPNSLEIFNKDGKDLTLGCTMVIDYKNDPDTRKIEKIKDNFDWFYANYSRIKKQYKNQFVAIKDKKHLDNDRDLEKLVERLNIKDYKDSIAIEFVYP